MFSKLARVWGLGKICNVQSLNVISWCAWILNRSLVNDSSYGVGRVHNIITPPPTPLSPASLTQRCTQKNDTSRWGEGKIINRRLCWRDADSVASRGKDTNRATRAPAETTDGPRYRIMTTEPAWNSGECTEMISTIEKGSSESGIM